MGLFDDETGPVFSNPQIRRQGKKTRALAAQRDVNTLPDPRTYAFVDGLMGTAPDQQGFSALHPDLASIQDAGKSGFLLSLISPFKSKLKGLPLGMSIKPVGNLSGANLANFGQKAEREAAIAKKVMKAAQEPVGLLDDAVDQAANAPVVNAKKAVRQKVQPDVFRNMQDEIGPDATLKALRKGAHLKPDGQGGYVGAPRHVDTPGKLGAMRRDLDGQFGDAVDALSEADPQRMGTWYDRAKAGQALTNEPYQLPRSLEQHAVYSAGVSPEAELGFALKHRNSRALGSNDRAYRGAGANTLDSAVAEDRPANLKFKIGEYHDKNDPRLPNEGLFGVNDFRAAQTFGYTTPDGQPWKAGVSDTMHPFMDGETGLMVDRARRNAVGGRSDWQGPHLQEVPWVYGKAQDIYARGKEARFKGAPGAGEAAALREANNTFEDYLYKHTASATHEAIPGKNTGHVPGLLEADDATKQAYSNTGRWDVPAPEVSAGLFDDPLQAGIGAGNRDALYGAAGFRQLPSVQTTGAYRNSAGQLETNPMTIARPLVDFPTGGEGEVNPRTLKALTAVERYRAGIDAQEAGAANLPNTMNAVKGKNALLFDTRGLEGGTATTGVQPSGAQLDALTGLLDDTGYGATATSRGAMVFPFGEAGPQDLQGLKRKLGPAMQDVLPGAKMEPATNAAPVYVPGLVPEQFTGRTTAGILDEFASAPPELARNIGESEGVRSIVRQKIGRDAQLPGARQDVQNMRSFFAEADWPKAVELMRQGMKPAAALAALGYSLNSMAAEDR